MDATKRVGLSLFPEVDDFVSHASQKSPEFRLCVACQFRGTRASETLSVWPRAARVEPEVYYSSELDL